MDKLEYKFSIIIPTYNRAELLKRCLNSLVEQTFKDFEVLVCDDGSVDNTKEIVKEFRNRLDIRYHWETNWGGPARPRNRGIELSKGEWICFLDSDDWWYPNKLEASLDYLNDYDLIHHDLDLYKCSEKVSGCERGRYLKGEYLKDVIINGNFIVNSSVIIRKKIIDLIGPISEDKNLIAVEDYDYWIRCIQLTNKVKYINKSFGGYWVGANISYSIKQIDRYKYLLDKYSNLLSIEEKNKSLLIYNYLAARLNHSHMLFYDAKVFYVKSFATHNLFIFFKSIIGYILCHFKIKR